MVGGGPKFSPKCLICRAYPVTAKAEYGGTCSRAHQEILQRVPVAELQAVEYVGLMADYQKT